MSTALRVLSMVEGTWVTGPIKPLIMFANMSRAPQDGGRAVSQSVMTTVRPGPEGAGLDNALLAALRRDGIPAHALTERHVGDLSLIRQMVQVIDQVRPDIVETHQVKCHFLLAQALLWRRLRKSFAWIAYHHGYTRANLKLSLYESLDRWSLRKPDQVVTVCRPFADELVRNGAPAARTSVISNAVDAPAAPSPDIIAGMRRDLGIAPDDVVLLTVGRLSREKAHAVLVESFMQLLKRVPRPEKLHLLIIGDGPERATLEKLGASCGRQLRFLGHNSQVWPYYFVGDVFVLPSYTEGSPLVLFEAMAAGRAIVATRVGGIPETVVDGDSAMLVEPGNVAALAAALERVCVDAGERARLAAGSARRAANFTPARYRERLLSLYAEVLSRGGARADNARA
jgi:glycosyltransferase involved in cell wall biosynthesis